MALPQGYTPRVLAATPCPYRHAPMTLTPCPYGPIAGVYLTRAGSNAFGKYLTASKPLDLGAVPYVG